MTSPFRFKPGATALVALLVAAGVLAAVPADTSKPLLRRVSDPALSWGPCPPLFPQGCQIAVLQGDPAKAHADVFFRVPAGYAIPAHAHTSAEHLVLVEGELEVRYAGQSALVMRTGDFAYGPANLPHEGRCLSRTPCTLYIAFEQAVDALPHAGPLP